MSSNEPRSVELFISYAHEDEPLRQELTKHLTNLRRQGFIKEWHDREIRPGVEWDKEIDQHLQSARIILLLISPDFMASDYCNDVEVKQALERHQRGEAVVIPVVLRSVDWEGTPFRKLQALPKDAKPVMSWTDRDQALTEVARGIRKVAERLTGKGAPGDEPATAARRRWELVLDADPESLDKGRVDAAVEQLRQLSGDKSLRLLEVKPDSIRLILEGTADGFETVEKLYNSGRLGEVAGFKVDSVRVVLPEQDTTARGEEPGGATARRIPVEKGVAVREPSAKAARAKRAQPQMPQVKSAGESDGAFPMSVLREAIRAVPAVKYALGVAGIAAAVSVVAGFQLNFSVAVIGIILMFGLMTILVIFSSFARSTSRSHKPLALTLAWSFVTLTVLTSFFIFTSFFFAWPRPLDQTAAKITGAEAAATPAPSQTPSATPKPAQTTRTLHYWIQVCKPHTDPKCQKPFPLAGEINFEARYKIRLNVSSPQPGFLYVINEGPYTEGGLPQYVLLFPTQRVNQGSAGIDADRAFTFPSDSWLRLDADEGKEKLWLVWSSGRVSEFEAAARTVAGRPQDMGAVTVPGDIVAVRDALGRYAAPPPKVTRSEEQARTIVEAQADTLAYAVVIEHH